MAATKQPSGVAVARTAYLSFQCSWKINDDNYGAGHQLQWRINNTGKWKTVALQPTTTGKKINLTSTDFFPHKNKFIKVFTFRVRGKRNPVTIDGKTTKYDWSAWSEKSFNLFAPKKPKLTATLSDKYTNITNFAWTTEVDNTKGHYPFVNNEYQSILVRASNETDGSKLAWNSSNLDWRTGTLTANNNTDITEDTALLATDSYTRWMRIRSRGAGAGDGKKGVSDWRYAKHVYATPFAPVITDVKSSVPMSGVTDCSVDWTAQADAAHPVDFTTVKWAIDTPVADVGCPSTASWNDGPTLRDTSGSAKAAFSVAAQMGLDECLWVRVENTHDTNVSRSGDKLVAAGSLTAPSALSVATDDSTFMATVTATNNSAVPDSHLAVVYRDSDTDAFVAGIIEHGSSSVTIQCPGWTGKTVDFGVYAFQGDYTAVTRADGVSEYNIVPNMTSTEVWRGGTLPQAPTNVTAEQTETSGEVLLRWDWNWQEADIAELSWSTNINAWESTDEPDTYTITNLHAAKWRISGLNTGEIWYFRVRLATAGADENTYGPYSPIVSVDLSSAPNVPILQLTDGVIPEDGRVTASWQYISTDGTQQMFAEVCECTVNGTAITYGDILATAQGESHVTLSAQEAGWNTGSYHYIAVRVMSESNHVSGWSDPVPVIIADPVTCEITQTSLNNITIEDDDGETRTVDALEAMPLTLTVTGAGEGGTTTVVIERAETYMIERPDESHFNGYEGETIAIYTQSGEAQITIDELIGSLDDGAAYRIIATVRDSYGQSNEQMIDFEVHWSHKASDITGTAAVDNTELISVLSAAQPLGYATGDTFDIYRLSADLPVLIVEDGAFDTEYVDPYPSIGEHGGYRFVYKTINGDYITADDTFAWDDVEAGLTSESTIIDFGGNRVVLDYDMTVSHSWEKDFTETTYLGGAIQGDWNLSVHRSVSLNADAVVIDDPNLIRDLRRLAAYPGICHVRAVDGSTFAADVQVSESRGYDTAGKIAAFSISIKQVDTQHLDGVLRTEWEASK